MKHRTRIIVAAVTLALSLAPGAAFAQGDPETPDDPTAQSDTGATPAEAGPPDPYGVCLDGECSLPEISREDLELLDDPDVLFTDDQDPPVPVVCFEGQSTCLLNTGGLSIEDLRITSGGRVVHGAVDVDPTGGWQVDNLRGTMTCRHPARRFTETLRRSSGAGIIQRRDDGRLVAEGLGEDEASLVLARLGPGVYATVFRIEEQGTRMAMHFFLGMVSADEIQGTLFAESTTRVQGARVRCAIERNFDLVRTSGPDEPGPSEAPGSSEAPGMDFTEDEVAGDDDPDAMDFTEDEVTGDEDG